MKTSSLFRSNLSTLQISFGLAINGGRATRRTRLSFAFVPLARLLGFLMTRNVSYSWMFGQYTSPCSFALGLISSTHGCIRCFFWRFYHLSQFRFDGLKIGVTVTKNRFGSPGV